VESPGQEAAAHSPRSGVMFERAADQEIGGAKAWRSKRHDAAVGGSLGGGRGRGLLGDVVVEERGQPPAVVETGQVEEVC